MKRNGRALTNAALHLCIGAALVMNAEPLESFGYKRMTVNRTEASGARPLAVVLMQFDNAPGFYNRADYYDHLIFNAFQTSVNGFYLENSHGRFYWTRAGAG